MSLLPEVDTFGVVPIQDGEPEYDYKALCLYCKENNKKPEALTEKELKQFVIGRFERYKE
jgi:hypothetical protein